MDQLTQLKKMTVVVADTGDLAAIEKFSPQDATTNPSLILKTVEMPEYAYFLKEALEFAKSHTEEASEILSLAGQYLAVAIGSEILKRIPGRVSTEVDARLSFDTEATVRYARQLIDLYCQKGVDPSRVLIKIAATWEGIRAAAVLEKEGIACNLTLIFHFAQAVACAEAKVTLISPFVGRIYDWYKARQGQDFTPEQDPGVLSVREIYHYYRHFKCPTIVMGASFRNIGQIQALAGCDYLTISPKLLTDLQATTEPLTRKLSAEDAQKLALQPRRFTASELRLALSRDPMTNEKLAEGIRLFAEDTEKLEQVFKQQLSCV